MRYDRIPERKIATIHNGIDLSRVTSTLPRATARARLGLTEQVFLLGCVARLEEQKGHLYLLRALALLVRNEPAITGSMRLLLVGDGRLRGQLEGQATSLGLTGMTSFLGTRRDVADILKALDVYVMPSLWEGLSLALLEAMAAGVPVIASDVGGVSQVLASGDYGVKVSPGSAEALAGAIHQLYLEPRDLLSARGSQGRQRVQGDFSLDAVIRKLTKIYFELKPQLIMYG
jgi:glycosyltransferase involved in cell wall biosynthesis